MNTRIKKLRKSLDLTQQEFASRIGTTANVLTNYETGRRSPSSSVINNICKTFKVNEEWLRTGGGEMFQPSPSAALDALAMERNLSHGDYVMIEKFLNLKQADRQVIAHYIQEVAAALNSDDVSPDSPEFYKTLDVEAQVEEFRRELLAERKAAEESSVSQNDTGSGTGKMA